MGATAEQKRQEEVEENYIGRMGEIFGEVGDVTFSGVRCGAGSL